MSVEELRARIDELSSEIDIQEMLVKKLKEDRSLVQYQLNAALDPVARLPVEISSEIFMQSLAPFPEPGARHAPMLLLSICHAWSAIAISTPDLWASIQIDFPCGEGFIKILPLWLQRARKRPLSISLGGDLGSLEPCILSIIWEHGKQLKHLEISDDCDDEGNDEVFVDLVDLFGGRTLEPLPWLETLTLRSGIYGRSFLFPQILEVLRLAPNLVQCLFNGMEPLVNVDVTSGRLVLPNLRRLIFGKYGGIPEGDDQILKSLSLPGLEVLSVSMQTVSGVDLLSFFNRSTPPLQELVLHLNNIVMDSLQLQECLRLIPILARLTMYRPHSECVADLVSALADSSSLLPNLCRLTIHASSRFYFLESFWRTLLRVLAARRTQLEIFGVEAPPADLLPAFRELVSDGMQLYIGTRERNFVVA